MDSVRQRELAELALTVAWKLTFHTYQRNWPVGDELRRQGLARQFKDNACKAALEYVCNRGDDNALPYEPESTLIPDLARLMVPIIKPGQLYADGCKKVALSVSRCLLQSEGFSYKGPRHRDDYEATILGIEAHPETNRKSLQGKIARVIERDWRFTGDVRVDAFAEVTAFRELNGHDLTAFGR